MPYQSFKNLFLPIFLFLNLFSFSQSVKFSELKKNSDDQYTYKEKLFTGKSVLNHANNRKWQEVDWKNGEIDGLYRSFYETGIKETEIEYTSGKRNGFYKSWYSNGKPEEFSNYKLGVLDTTKPELPRKNVPTKIGKWTAP